MVLTTQCPSCQTTFRVASDQLKLRAGLVRCGACNEVFDGSAHLLANPAASPPVSSEIMSQAAAASAGSAEAELDARANAPVEPAADDAHINPEESAAALTAHPETEIEATAAADVPAEHPETEIEATAAADVSAEADTLPEAESLPSSAPTPADHLLPRVAASTTHTVKESAFPEAPHEVEEPGFVTRARRAERVGKALRVSMWLGCVLLFFTLLGQASYSLRHYLAAYMPQSQPYLQRFCATVGCKLELLKQIDAIAIEATELQQSTLLKDTLVLTTLLRNRSSVTQAWPNLELSLNDANEKVMVRRIFTAVDYLPQPKEATKGFAAGSEQSVKLVFEVTQLKPSGFRVYLFYP